VSSGPGRVLRRDRWWWMWYWGTAAVLADWSSTHGSRIASARTWEQFLIIYVFRYLNLTSTLTLYISFWHWCAEYSTEDCYLNVNFWWFLYWYTYPNTVRDRSGVQCTRLLYFLAIQTVSTYTAVNSLSKQAQFCNATHSWALSSLISSCSIRDRTRGALARNFP